MALITEPNVIAFSDNELRPLAEILVALTAKMDDFIERYANLVKPTIDAADPAAILADSADQDGRAELTADDIKKFRNKVNVLLTELQLPGTETIISLPAVNKISINLGIQVI